MDFLLDKKIKAWLKECERIIQRPRTLEIDTKEDDKDLVTDVDREIETYLIGKIKESYPNDWILGEEGTKNSELDYNSLDRLWVIDPIDGTSNFVRQRRDYCTMVSYFEGGTCKFTYIYDYYHKELLSAFEGIGVFINEIKLAKPANIEISKSIVSLSSGVLRNDEYVDKIAEMATSIRAVGSSGLDGIRVCKGEFGAYINVSGAPWDFAPFILIAKELDLHVSRPDGQALSLNDKSGFILSTKSIYNSVKDIL